MDVPAIRRPPHFSPFHLLPAWQEPICGGAARPLTDGRSAYVLCEHNQIFAFAPEPSAGRALRWRHKVDEMRVTAAETMGNGVLIGTDENLHALDAATGQRRWLYALASKGARNHGGWNLMPSASALRHCPPVIHVLNHYGLATLDARTGGERSFIAAWRDWDHLAAEPERIYLASLEEGSVEAIEPGCPWPLWTYQCSAGIKVSPALDGEALYCISHDGNLHVLDKAAGRLLARHPLGVRAAAPPLVDDGVVYLVTDDAELRAWSARAGAGEWAWVFDSPCGRLTGAVLAGQALYVAGVDGVVYGLAAESGEPFWQHDLGARDVAGLCWVGGTLVAAARGRAVGFRPAPATQESRPTSAASDGTGGDPAVPAAVEKVSFAVTAVPAGQDLELRDPHLPRVRWHRLLPAPAAAEIAVRFPLAYVPCEDETLTAVHLADGAVAWRSPAGGPILSRPQLAGSLVIVSTARHVCAFAADDGRASWRHQARHPIAMNAHAGEDAIAYALAGGGAVCLESGDGNLRWQSDPGEKEAISACSHGDHLFVASKQQVVARRLTDGRESWRSPLPDRITGPLAASGGRIFAGCHDQRLYAVAAEDGSLLWGFRTRDEIRHAPTAAGELLYLAGLDGSLYALRAEDGSLAWRFHFGTYPEGSPCVAAATVCFGARDGLVYGLEAGTGRLAWKHDLGGEGLRFAPAADGLDLLAATRSDRLLCLRLTPTTEGRPR